MEDRQAKVNSSLKQNTAYRLIQVDGTQDTNTSVDSFIDDLWEQDHDFFLDKDWELNYYGAISPLSPLTQPKKTIVSKFSHLDTHWWEKNSPDNPVKQGPNQKIINKHCNFRNLKSSLPASDCFIEAGGCISRATTTLQVKPKVSNSTNPESSDFRYSEDDSSGRG